MDYLPYLIPLFFLTAVVYSMAGFGGGSTYIAILVLFALPYEAVPKTALICNLIVASGALYAFWRYFSARRVLPFIATSIPAAYVGGLMPVGKTFFSLLLGISLLMAALRMGITDEGFESRRQDVSWKTAWAAGLSIGALLGLLSGLVGIGGGIFLSPILYFLGWANARQAAAASAFFILVNSLSGLAGQWMKDASAPATGFLLPLAIAVFAGGQIGSRLGSQRIPKLFLQRFTAALLLWTSVRLFGEIGDVVHFINY